MRVSDMIEINWCLLNSYSKSKTHCDLFQVRLSTCSFMYSTNIYWVCMMPWPGAGHGGHKGGQGRPQVYPSRGVLTKRFKTYRKTKTGHMCGSLSCYLMHGHLEFLRR